MRFFTRLKSRSIAWLVRLACCLALVALAIMTYSIVVPRPLPVIFAMSVGHVVGALAFVVYFASVLLDISEASNGTRGRKISAPESKRT